MLTGSIDGDELSLQGVSYSYIQQGKSETYDLDGFRLRFAEDGALIGHYPDPGGGRQPIEVRLEKVRLDEAPSSPTTAR